MQTGAAIEPRTSLTPSRLVPILVSVLLFGFGAFGFLIEAWGYGLLLIATVALFFGAGLFFIFILTRYFDTQSLKQTFVGLLRLGGWLYVLGVAALSGFFVDETLHGRMELNWILFGPTVLAAVIFLDLGVYRLLIKKNLPTWQRFGHLVSRDLSDPESMRRTLVDDVIMHRSLLSVSRFRWFKHTLIFWGFSLMFGAEILAVFVREAIPAFGMRDIWEELDHPIRRAFDFAYDFTGLMVLLGCVLALIWRVVVNGKPEQKYSDTPTALFLFFVVLSGFVLEGARISVAGADAMNLASFVGVVFSYGFSDGGDIASAIYQPLWYVHVFGSCAFIAYVPVKRLIHSCATPMGRLMNSQTDLLAAKKKASIRGLLIGKQTD
ncbi:MAG: hypothetical protein HOK25_03860 [Rhodospirillaceae bacterium]|nr:hypothetical protein [Rhodospirillaceae bacterium]